MESMFSLKVEVLDKGGRWEGGEKTHGVVDEATTVAVMIGGSGSDKDAVGGGAGFNRWSSAGMLSGQSRMRGECCARDCTRNGSDSPVRRAS